MTNPDHPAAQGELDDIADWLMQESKFWELADVKAQIGEATDPEERKIKAGRLYSAAIIIRRLRRQLTRPSAGNAELVEKLKDIRELLLPCYKHKIDRAIAALQQRSSGVTIRPLVQEAVKGAFNRHGGLYKESYEDIVDSVCAALGDSQE